jgi:hypothetical protein
MKKALAIIFVSVLLFSAVGGTSFVNLASASSIWPFPDPTPEITVQTPKNGTTYFQEHILLTLTTTTPFGSDITITYRLDHQASAYMTMSKSDGTEYSAMLSSLSEGWHTLDILAYGENSNGESGTDTASIMFLVDAVKPKITILSPQNKTYTVSDLPLNFTLSEKADWIGYSLDEQLVTISGNTTLVGLSEGLHSLTVYANDTIGRKGNSETVAFNVTRETEHETQQDLEPFPTTLVITAFGASLAMVAAGVLVYFRKRRHQGVPS